MLFALCAVFGHGGKGVGAQASGKFCSRRGIVAIFVFGIGKAAPVWGVAAGRLLRLSVDFAPQPVIGVNATFPDPFQHAQPVGFEQQSNTDEKQQGIDTHHQLYRPDAQQFDGDFLTSEPAARDGEGVDGRGGVQRKDAAEGYHGDDQRKAFPRHELGIEFAAA